MIRDSRNLVSDAVGHSLDACLPGAVGAAVEGAALLNAVAEHLAAAVSTGRGQGMDGALEAVERLSATILSDCEGLVIVVAAHFTLRHDSPSVMFCKLDILMSAHAWQRVQV